MPQDPAAPVTDLPSAAAGCSCKEVASYAAIYKIKGGLLVVIGLGSLVVATGVYPRDPIFWFTAVVAPLLGVYWIVRARALAVKAVEKRHRAD